MLRYTLYTFLSKRRSAKYRLPTEIYSPLRRIWTLKTDGLTTHRERSLSVHCLHSSVLFFIIFRHRGILLFNFPYHTLPIRETEDTMPVKLFGQAFSINPFQYFGYQPFYVFGKQAVGKSIIVKVYSEIYRQHRRKQFPYRQGINIFVSVSVQLL